MKKYTLLLFLCLFTALQINAQSIFGVSAVAGGSISQITGDREAGFNKIGLHAGLDASIYLSPRTELGVGIIYDQRGSASSRSFENLNFPFKIKLDYVMVPVTYTIKDWFDEEEGFYKMHFTGGLAYGRLISATQTSEALSPNCLNSIAENDLSYQLGVTFYATEHWGFTAYHLRSLFKSNTSLSRDTCSENLFLYQWTFRAEYRF